MSRQDERRKIIQLIYEMNIKNEETIEHLDDYIASEYARILFSIEKLDDEEIIKENKIKQSAYTRNLLSLYIEHKDEIMDIVSKASTKWSVKRISKVDMSIIKLATTEILYIDKIPKKVSVNEAVELAKEFSSDDAYKFVNGILSYVIDYSEQKDV